MFTICYNLITQYIEYILLFKNLIDKTHRLETPSHRAESTDQCSKQSTADILLSGLYGLSSLPTNCLI